MTQNYFLVSVAFPCHFHHSRNCQHCHRCCCLLSRLYASKCPLFFNHCHCNQILQSTKRKIITEYRYDFVVTHCYRMLNVYKEKKYVLCIDIVNHVINTMIHVQWKRCSIYDYTFIVTEFVIIIWSKVMCILLYTQYTIHIHNIHT